MNMPDQLLLRYPLLSDQVDKREVAVVLRELEAVLATTNTGDIVEFGCYVGTTSLFMSRLLVMQKSPRVLHVYDSFEGLPEKSLHDRSPAGDQFRKGELFASKKQFVENYKKAGVMLPRIHKGWFSELSDTDIPDNISFAFLDGDYYESIMTPLTRIWPRLVPGARIVIDDYANEALPGAAKAVNKWLLTHPATLRVEHSLALLII